jgi:hypothetical protein
VSVLDRFVRIRGYRTRAAGHYNLTSGPYNDDVKARYFVIGDYYAGLAEAELVADRLEQKKRLEEMRRGRSQPTTIFRIESVLRDGRKRASIRRGGVRD